MSSQLPPEVPAGWSAQWSARHQTWVYVDLKSLNIQWMCPTEPPPGHVITPPVSPTTPSRGEPSVPAGWKPKWHQSYGAWYYVNSQTGKSQWNRPQYAAIPANAYSPIDHSHKPVDWDECAPSPLVTKFPKSLHLSLNLDRQPMSGFEHLFSGNINPNPAPLTPGFFSPPPPKAAPPSPPRLCIDTKHAQGRQRPVSPAHAFIPAFRPRAISDCPPVLPDIPLSQIEAPHPSPLNPYTQARHSFLAPPGPGLNVAHHQARHSMSNFPTSSRPYGGGYGSAYAPPPPPRPKPQPQLKAALGVPIQKVNANRGHHRWASTPEIVLRKPLTPKIEMATELPAAEIPILQEKEVLAPTIIVAPMPTPPLDPTPPLESASKPPARAPLGDIRQLLRTKTIGYTQRSWPVGAQDRGYYPTRVVEEAEEDGYESDSSYCTDYAEDEPERSPVVSFTPVLNKPTGRESWELAY